jgi:hypothetical protein
VPFGDAVWYNELHTLVGGCVRQRRKVAVVATWCCDIRCS